jgi:flagellar hook protein FlgE
LTLSNPTLTSNPSVSTGDTITPAAINVTFDSNGVLVQTDVGGVPTSPLTLDINGAGGPGANLSTGAAPSTFTFNVGTLGKTDGVTQLDSSSSTPTLGNPSFTQDGALYGQLSTVTIDKNGLVTAAFDNGVKLPVYQIPLATFPNPNGLTPVSGTTYSENQSAGNVGLRMPGQGGAGTLEASAIEGSTTDIAGEFNKMIVAQQAYSAASQVVTTVKSMFDTLTSAMR